MRSRSEAGRRVSLPSVAMGVAQGSEPVSEPTPEAQQHADAQPTRYAEETPDAKPQRHPLAPAPGEALPAHNPDCFGCGELRPHGLHMRLVAGEGVTVSARFRVTDDHQGAHSLAHGGVLAAACDEALGGLLWLLRAPAVTAHLDVDYHLPVPVGREVFLRAQCRGVRGRKVHAHCEGRLDGEDGPLAVSATALFVRVPVEHFARHGQPQEGGHPPPVPEGTTLYGP